MTTLSKKRSFGLIPQGPDPRDFDAPEPTDRAIVPPKFKIEKLPPVFDQKSLGSCTANMMVSIFSYLRLRQGLKPTVFSRLAQYYWTRSLMGTTGSDSGASIRDAFKAINKFGAGGETYWPYVVSKFKDKPTKPVTDDALKHRPLGYGVVDQNLEKVKAQIAAGNPIGFGFAVWSSFYNIGKDGVMPMPDISRERIEGYHAVYAYGYDDETRMVDVRNSWGEGWGLKGSFKMPYDFFFDKSMVFDLWAAWLTAQVE